MVRHRKREILVHADLLAAAGDLDVLVRHGDSCANALQKAGL
jgi:hypothetical protein